MIPVPTVKIVDTAALPRPEYDAHYEPGLVSDYYQVRRGYHILRRKGSATSYLVYSLSGHGFVRDEKNHVLRLGRGDLALIEPHTYQEYGTWPEKRQWECHWVHFDAQPDWVQWLPLAERTELPGVSMARVGSRAIQHQLSELFFQLHTERKRPEVWSNALALNLLERILILARSYAHCATAQAVDPRIWRVLQAIEACAPDPPKAAQLRRVAGLSASRLSFLFKQNTGISILAAVNRVRLRAAQLALQEVGTSIGDAARRSGFQSPYSFSNWYLKQTGLRPGDYRRRWFDMMRPQRAKATRRSSS